MRGRSSIVLVVLGVLLAGCASRASAAHDVSNAPDATTTSTDAVAVSSTTTTTRVFDPPCGGITAELVSTALGRTATFESADPGGCAFVAGPFRFAFGSLVFPPTDTGLERTSSEQPASMSIILLTNDRSGRWYAMGSLTLNGQNLQWSLVDGASGSDTYPPQHGPAQRPLTADAANALVGAITGLR